VNKYALTDFSTYYSDACQECAQVHTNTLMPMENKNIHDYNFYMLSALKWKYKLFNVHIYFCCGRAFVCPVIFTGGLLSAPSFLRVGFCPPCHFHMRAFVRPVIFTGGLLSALSFLDGRAFVREGFFPTLKTLKYCFCLNY
jgi:hypothetical protein